VYYDQEFEYLQAKYLAHMAIGPDQNLLAIYTGNYYDYRRNGRLESVIFYEEGERNGPATFYNRFGLLKQEGFYSHDLRAGIWRFYDKKGVFKYEMDYKTPPAPIKLEDFDSPQPPQRHE
jgi:antitoxin component YwqK of YwqJK toxin-antitoxin module